MSEKNIPKKYSELRSIYKNYIDAYNALYQLKTEKGEGLNTIYKMIKTELIEFNKQLPQNIIRDISNMSLYNNRYTKSYLSLAKLISDEYHVTDVSNIEIAFNFLYYKEYGIKLDKSGNFDKIKFKNLDIHTENTIYSAIMNDDKEAFISFTQREGFDKNQELESRFYPKIKRKEDYGTYDKKYSLLDLCCYHGAIDCFKFLRTKYRSEITQSCLQLSFLGRNKEILSECLKYKKPDEECMKFAMISHNIDFVTFLMNEHKMKFNPYDCGLYKNLESFLVYCDQNHNYHKCIVHSAMFTIPSLLEYFVSHGGYINKSNQFGDTALHYAARFNSKEMAELLFSRRAFINKINNSGQTALHIAARTNSKEVAELLISHGANINEKDDNGNTSLHIAASKNSKQTAELLISHGANINEKNKYGRTALYITAFNNSTETAELLISHGANINEKNKYGRTALYMAVLKNNKETVEVLVSHNADINEGDRSTPLHIAIMNENKEIAEILISHGANLNKRDEFGKTALHMATEYNSKEIVELLISYGANIHEENKYGRTAIYIARLFGYEEIAKLLISHGANISRK